jgi:hypothetical protein
MKHYRITAYRTALVLLFVATCLAASPKFDKFIPPAESHGKTLSGYGCDRMQIADSAAASKGGSYWSLLLWAQYGDDHKRYWQKTYDTFHVTIGHAVQNNGESAGGGGAIAPVATDSYDLTPMANACASWAAVVKSTLKIDGNGQKSKD